MLRRMPSMLLLLLLFLETAASSSSEKSAYEALRSHGLPMGILPKGVRDFRMSTESSAAAAEGEWVSFDAVLDAPCTAAEGGGILRYDRNVSGRMSVGEIAFVSGISARDLFLWFPVRDIRVDVPASGLIYLDVGVVEKKLPLALFESPADCSPDDDEEGDADPGRIADLLLPEIQLISPPFDPPGSSSSSSM